MYRFNWLKYILNNKVNFQFSYIPKIQHKKNFIKQSTVHYKLFDYKNYDFTNLINNSWYNITHSKK